MAGPNRDRESGANRESLPTASLRPVGDAAAALARGLGRREQEIMKVLWVRGSASVLEVAQCLSIALAYTTVMTTLDRLFKKGLLERRKKNRAFIYSASLTAGEMERRRAASLVERFFSDSHELESRIRLARAQGMKSTADSGISR